jgi:hypothetical protein
MNIQVSNTDGQLRVVQNGRVRFYNLKTIKSVDSLCDTNNDYYLVINFIANDKENALNLFLKDITNQATWTNTSAGAEVAKEDISGWMQDAIVISGTVSLSTSTLTALESVTVQNPAGAAAVNIQDGGNIITVDSNAIERTPTILRTSASSSVAAGAYSASFASVGTVDATVGGVTLKVGETISFDAGGIDNTLSAITYDSSTAGAELLIITIV